MFRVHPNTQLALPWMERGKVSKILESLVKVIGRLGGFAIFMSILMFEREGGGVSFGKKVMSTVGRLCNFRSWDRQQRFYVTQSWQFDRNN
jgi:hypothetical protein